MYREMYRDTVAHFFSTLFKSAHFTLFTGGLPKGDRPWFTVPVYLGLTLIKVKPPVHLCTCRTAAADPEMPRPGGRRRRPAEMPTVNFLKSAERAYSHGTLCTSTAVLYISIACCYVWLYTVLLSMYYCTAVPVLVGVFLVAAPARASHASS